MIISKETIAVLQNFQTINPSIILREGNVIATQTPSDTIHARATIEDEFPRTIPIYDLNKFLGILALTKEDSDIEFSERYMTITQGKSTVRYAYTSESQIVSPPIDKTINISNPDVTFELTQEVWSRLSNAMRVMGFSEFAFVGEDGILSIQALSTKNDSSDTYSTDIGETDKTFSCVIEATNMRIIPGNYSVSVLSKGLSHFKGDIAEYWIGISTRSTFGEE